MNDFADWPVVMISPEKVIVSNEIMRDSVVERWQYHTMHDNDHDYFISSRDSGSNDFISPHANVNTTGGSSIVSPTVDDDPASSTLFSCGTHAENTRDNYGFQHHTSTNSKSTKSKSKSSRKKDDPKAVRILFPDHHLDQIPLRNKRITSSHNANTMEVATPVKRRQRRHTPQSTNTPPMSVPSPPNIKRENRSCSMPPWHLATTMKTPQRRRSSYNNYTNNNSSSWAASQKAPQTSIDNLLNTLKQNHLSTQDKKRRQRHLENFIIKKFEKDSTSVPRKQKKNQRFRYHKNVINDDRQHRVDTRYY